MCCDRTEVPFRPRRVISNSSQNYSINSESNLEMNVSPKEFICVRLEYIPLFSEIYRQSISNLEVKDVDKFVVVNATVIRVANRKTSERSKLFQCTSCGFQVKGFADHADMNKIKLPPRCTNLVSKQKKTNPMWDMLNKLKNKNNNKQPNNVNNFRANNSDGLNENQQNRNTNNKAQKVFTDECGCPRFDPVPDSQQFIDYQEIKIQESFRTIKPGNVPRTIWVILEVSNTPSSIIVL